MRVPFSPVLPVLFLTLGVAWLEAQDASKNLISNGGFERSIRLQNPWEGLTSAGILQGSTEEAPVLTQSGSISPSKMPISVSAGDLNGDGLPDIAAMDGNGYLRVYFNIGTKTEAKFGKPEFASLLLNPKPLMEPVKQAIKEELDKRSVQRIHLADISKSGKLDLLIGTYGGQLFFVPNTGSTMKPDFRTPSRLESSQIPTGKNAWGNVFSPFALDWNGDGRMDILVGEGSYSANSIHLLAGKKAGVPAFDDADRSVLAYGMGLEQLVPCVVDYNGDGKKDLLVVERGGKVAVYLNPGKPLAPGETLPFDSFITVDGAAPAGVTDKTKDPLEQIKATNLLNAGGASTISVGDFNGDGLFDLLFGKRSGRVALALNKGSATAPNFAQPVDIKSPILGQDLLTPSSWTTDAGLERGNFNGYVSVVKAGDAGAAQGTEASPEGKAFLKAGYTKASTTLLAPLVYPKPGTRDEKGIIFTPNRFIVSQVLPQPLKVGKTYILTFKVRGAQVSDGVAELTFSGYKKLGEDKLVRGERGAVSKQLNDLKESKFESTTFSAGANWSEVKKEFAIKFENKELNDTQDTKAADLRLSFLLSPGTGEVAFDDFKLVEKL